MAILGSLMSTQGEVGRTRSLTEARNMIAITRYLAWAVEGAAVSCHSLTRVCTSARLTAFIRISPMVGKTWLRRTISYVASVLGARTWRASHRSPYDRTVSRPACGSAHWPVTRPAVCSSSHR